jgi:predicted RNA-binding Zn ribbon-like protein
VGFTADQRRALIGCAELVNSARDGGGLADPAGLLAFARGFGVDRPAQPSGADLDRIRELGRRLRDAIAACAGSAEHAARTVNALLAETGGVPQVVMHDGEGPHFHLARPGARLPDRLAAHFALALAELIVAGEQSRIRLCEAPGCAAAFVDFSRNRSRRYCDGRGCGNRVHVAAYRARRSAPRVAARRRGAGIART